MEHLHDDALNLHFDGELPPDETANVSRHLAACDECEKRLRSLERLRDAVAMSIRQDADQVDFDALFSRIEAATKAAPAPSLWARLGVWVSESLEHNPFKVWAPTTGLALAVAAVAVVAVQSVEPPSDELAGRRPADPRERRREPMMLAAGEQKTPATGEDDSVSNASEVVQVDFGDHTGTVFEIALADGASTPVVWINDEE